MKEVGICGHFAGNKDFLDGQTIKTKIITEEIVRYYGKKHVKCVDTYGGKKKILRKILSTIGLMKNCNNVIILPAQNGVLAFVPILAMANNFYKRKLHYIVVGGWLPEFVETRKWLVPFLKKFNYIYVETAIMKLKLEELGLYNTVVLPNCKNLKILEQNELLYFEEEPLKLCTFSRVMKEKGIEEAVEVVKYINMKAGRVRVSLDIYGQVDLKQIEWFEDFKTKFPDYVSYKGAVPFEKSTEVLKEYVALLFPTYYEGEGFAGTLIDAMAAGVPVIASDWHYNSEIIENGKTGIIVKQGETFAEKIYWMLDNKKQWNDMKKSTLVEARKYLPQNALKQLFVYLK